MGNFFIANQNLRPLDGQYMSFRLILVIYKKLKKLKFTEPYNLKKYN